MIRKVTIVLAVMSAAAAAQSSNGYLFVAPGGVTSGGYTSMTIQAGAGADIHLVKGLGLNLELGAVGPRDDFSAVVGMFSPGATWYFRRGKELKLEPFVNGGYTLMFREGHANLFYFGGGANYWPCATPVCGSSSATRSTRSAARPPISGASAWDWRCGEDAQRVLADGTGYARRVQDGRPQEATLPVRSDGDGPVPVQQALHEMPIKWANSDCERLVRSRIARMPEDPTSNRRDAFRLPCRIAPPSRTLSSSPSNILLSSLNSSLTTLASCVTCFGVNRQTRFSGMHRAQNQVPANRPEVNSTGAPAFAARSKRYANLANWSPHSLRAPGQDWRQAEEHGRRSSRRAEVSWLETNSRASCVDYPALAGPKAIAASSARHSGKPNEHS